MNRRLCRENSAGWRIRNTFLSLSLPLLFHLFCVTSSPFSKLHFLFCRLSSRSSILCSVSVSRRSCSQWKRKKNLISGLQQSHLAMIFQRDTHRLMSIYALCLTTTFQHHKENTCRLCELRGTPMYGKETKKKKKSSNEDLSLCIYLLGVPNSFHGCVRKAF